MSEQIQHFSKINLRSRGRSTSFGRGTRLNPLQGRNIDRFQSSIYRQYFRLNTGNKGQKLQSQKSENIEELNKAKDNLQNHNVQLLENIRQQQDCVQLLQALHNQRRKKEYQEIQMAKYQVQIQNKEKLLEIFDQSVSQIKKGSNKRNQQQLTLLKINIEQSKQESKRYARKLNAKKKEILHGIYQQRIQKHELFLKRPLLQIQEELIDVQFYNEWQHSCSDKYKARLDIWMQRQRKETNSRFQQQKKLSFEQKKEQLLLSKSQLISNENRQFALFQEQQNAQIHNIWQQEQKQLAEIQKSKSKIQQIFTEKQKRYNKDIEEIHIYLNQLKQMQREQAVRQIKQFNMRWLEQIEKQKQFNKRQLQQIEKQKQQRIIHQLKRKDLQGELVNNRIHFLQRQNQNIRQSLIKFDRRQNDMEREIDRQKSQDIKKQLIYELISIREKRQLEQKKLLLTQQQLKHRRLQERRLFDQKLDVWNRIEGQFQNKIFELKNNKSRRGIKYEQEKIQSKYKEDIQRQQQILKKLKQQKKHAYQSYKQIISEIQSKYQQKHKNNYQKKYELKQRYAERSEKRQIALRLYQNKYQEQMRIQQINSERIIYKRKIKQSKYLNYFNDYHRCALEQWQKMKFQSQKIDNQLSEQICRLQDYYEDMWSRLSQSFSLINIQKEYQNINTQIFQLGKLLKKIKKNNSNRYQVQQSKLGKKISQILLKLKDLKVKQQKISNYQKKTKYELTNLQKLIDVMISIDRQQQSISQGLSQ